MSCYWGKCPGGSESGECPLLPAHPNAHSQAVAGPLTAMTTIDEVIVELKVGTRLRSTTDATEIIVVKAPGASVDLRCGGLPFEPFDGPPTPSTPVEGFDGGTELGKRYSDKEGTVEVLCTKGGLASISIGEELLSIKGAKALPSSD